MQTDSLDLIWGLIASVIAFSALVAVIIALAVISQRQLIRAQREKLRSLKESEERYRALAVRLQSAREEERTHVAREIHDELGQILTATYLELLVVEKRIAKLKKRSRGLLPIRRIARVRKTLESTITSVGEITAELRPVVLDRLGLRAAIEWQAREFQRRTRIRTRTDLSGGQVTLDQKQSTALFRIFQETLTNVARHAGAKEVHVSLRANGGYHVLEIRDDGRGVTERDISKPEALGILGMKERALVLGGELRIEGRRGRGTVVTLRIPHNGKK